MCKSDENSGQEYDDKTGSMAGFQMEMERWRDLTRQERICKECDSGEVEDVDYWSMRCEAWKSQCVQLEA